MAAVLYLAESNREKTESQILKKTDEKIVFLAEAHYPTWVVPYNTANLVFDGLAQTSHTITYDKIPDIEIFNRDIKRKQRTTEAYTAAISRNMDYFQNYKGKEKTNINGLVTQPELKADLKNYFLNMRETRKPLTNSIILPPTIESQDINTSNKQLADLRKTINKDIENMDATMKLLNTTTKQRIKTIREEIKKTREEYRKKINKTESESTRKICQIQHQYNRKINGTSRGFNKRLTKLNKNRTKFRKVLKTLKKEGKRCRAKIQSSRRHKRKRTEANWSLKLKKINKKLSTLQKEINQNNKRIRQIENSQKRELAKQKTDYLTRIESAGKTYRNLQGSTEAEIMIKRQEIATLEDTTRNVTKSLQEMVVKKKTFREEFDKLTIPRGKQTRRLVYLPFYLARYEKGEKKRYNLYPPSIIGDMGITTKMKGALGATKVKALLQPRSEHLTAFLNHLPALLEKRPMLEKTITETGISNSILLKKRLRVGVKRGLKELENQNWISKNELQTISKLLYIYSPSPNRQPKTLLITENNQLKCLTA